MRRVVAAALGLASVAAALGASAEPPAGAASCSGCHPTASVAASPVPRLLGLDRATIVRAMQEFRSGKRTATVMDRIAKGFSDDEIQTLAAWFASQR